MDLLTVLPIVAAFLSGLLVGGFIEWSKAKDREEAQMRVASTLLKQRQDADRVIDALREVITKGMVRP